MFYVPTRPAAIRAMRGKKQTARSEPLPFDPDDLVRRLNIVLAEQHLQELQLGKKSQAQDVEWHRPGRKLNIRGRRDAAPAKETQSQSELEQQSHSSSKGEQRRSVRWTFRAKPAYSARQSDEECASAARSIPQHAYNTLERAAAIRQAQSQRDMRQEHDDPHQAGHTLVLDLKNINEIGRVGYPKEKENNPPDWAQTDAIDSKPRALQLLKRISSISTLKSRLGGEPRVVHDEGPSRIQIDSILEEGPAAHRKSGFLLKLRR